MGRESNPYRSTALKRLLVDLCEHAGIETENRVREYDADEFVEMLGSQTPEEGSHIETESGEVAEITHVGSDVVRLDFNHSLAGETLEFDIEIVNVN